MLKFVIIKPMKKHSDGFTLIELMIVVFIIGILTTIGIVSFSKIQAGSRDTQRSSKITVIAEALEKYYDKNGEYPNCDDITSSTVTADTLKGMSPDALITPSGNSIICNDPSIDAFGYVGGGTSYTLKYKEETTGQTKTVASRRTSTAAAPTTHVLSISAGFGGTVNTAVNGIYNSGDTPTITATPNAQYEFGSWTGNTGCSGVASHTITMNANKTCTANFTTTIINPPSPPVIVTPATSDSTTTTWSWNEVSCPDNTTRYQYDYLIDGVSQAPAGWKALSPTDTSIGFTTSAEGHTYTVKTQAQCYSGATSSEWSITSNAVSYYRPLTTYTLAISAGAGGTVNTVVNDTYVSGSTPTITATPNVNYAFISWTGDTGCSGVASHTITIDANKTCTANFIATYTLSISAGAGGTVNTAINGTYNSGSTPTITATPNANYIFGSWTGDTGCAGVVSHTIAMTANKTCVANFIATYTLSISAGTGGTVNTAVNGTYNSGSTPTITATPNANYAFSSWTGGGNCAGVASHTILMNANQTCVANFIATYTLTISANTGGTVNTAVNGTYNSGDTPTITATPNSGSAFVSWTGGGNCAGVASHTIAMTANQTCVANFNIYQLVGTIGAVTQGAVSAAVTPAWGTSENRTANNLLVCFVAVGGSATLPTTPSGWTIAKQIAGTSSSATIYYKTAAGGDATPTIAAITSGVISARLAEFSGGSHSSQLDRTGSGSGTSGTTTATSTLADTNSFGELILTANTIYYSVAATKTLTDVVNNTVEVVTNNAGTSTLYHYDFSYGYATTNASADSNPFTYTSNKITGAAGVIVSFKN
jgi:prepilin-type N-terminal cleavage/methylation domain-containing protein